MKVPSRLLKPTAVVASNDAGAAQKYQGFFEKAGYTVERCRLLREALGLVDSALPHVVLTDSFLPDGHAGNLFDKLHEERAKRRIPILVHITSRSPKDLTVLNKRSFAAFFHGEPLPKTFQAKLDEIELSAFDPPPYFLKAERLMQQTELKLRTKATLLGTYQDMVVLKTRVRLSARTAYACTPAAPHKGGAMLHPRLCLKTTGGYYCFVPAEELPADVAWLQNLPVLSPPSSLRPILPPAKARRVLYCHPDRSKYARLVQLLDGEGLEVVHADNLRVAAAIYAEQHGRFGCIYLNELLTDRAKDDWLRVYDAGDDDKPPLIVGTVGMPPPSSKNVSFLQQPVEPKALAGLLTAHIDGREDGELPFDFGPHAKAVIPCVFDVEARVVGLSESCIVVEHGCQMLEGTDLTLAHPMLAKLWSEHMRVKVETSVPSPSGAATWWSRLPVPAHGETKTQYWQRLVTLSEKGGEDEDAPKATSTSPFDANVLNVFIQSVYEVIEYYLGELPRLGKPSLTQKAPKPSTPAKVPVNHLAAGMTTITGAFVEGWSALVCDPQFVAMLAFRISGVSKEEALADREVLREVMEQLCDQIFGKARLFLESAGYVYDVTLPKVSFGGEPDQTPVRGKPIISIPFELNSKRFAIGICFAEK
jgi:CheY-like chemotaxis protein/CheY-specific phosphatase CheX